GQVPRLLDSARYRDGHDETERHHTVTNLHWLPPLDGWRESSRPELRVARAVERPPRRPLRRVARWSSSSAFVPRLDRCLKPVEIHVFQVRAAQFFAVSFVESVETSGVEDLPEWSAVTKNPDKRSFGSGAVYPERNGHETLPLGLSCSKILSRLLRSPRPCAVSC